MWYTHFPLDVFVSCFSCFFYNVELHVIIFNIKFRIWKICFFPEYLIVKVLSGLALLLLKFLKVFFLTWLILNVYKYLVIGRRFNKKTEKIIYDTQVYNRAHILNANPVCWLICWCLYLFRWTECHCSHHFQLLPDVLCTHQLLVFLCLVSQVTR